MKWRELGAKWFESPDFKSRIKAMEGIRGLAVILVFCVHYHQQFMVLLPAGTLQLKIANFVGEIGHCGVDLFFILSGYLIYGAAIKKNLHLWVFWRRRIQRIYPTFIVVLLIYILLSYFFPEKSKIPLGWMDKIILLSGNVLLLAGLFPIEPINTVTWSLSFEVFYYIMLPLLVVATRLNAWGRRYRVFFFIGLSFVYIVLFILGVLYRPGYWTHARMLMFISGIMLFELTNPKDLIKLTRVGEVVVVLVFVCSFYLVYILHGLSVDPGLFRYRPGIIIGQVLVMAVSYFYFCLYAFSPGSWFCALMVFEPIRWLGNMSYSYYLIHGLVIHFTSIILFYMITVISIDRSVAYWASIPCVFLASLVVSTVLFLVIEKPFSLKMATGNRILFYK